MSRLVSKVRAKKTRTREKQAGKASICRIPLQENPVIGLFVAVLLWSSVMLLLGAEYIFRHGATDHTVLLPLTGDGAFLFVGLFAAGLFLEIMKPGFLHRNSRILLLSLISLASLIPAKALLYVGERTLLIPPGIVGFFLPFALAPLLATMLVGNMVGIAVGVWTTLAMTILAGHSFPLFVTGMVATAVAIRTGRNVRTRSKVFRTGLVIGLSQITCVFGLTAVNWATSDPILILHQAGACLISGFFSALVVLLILPFFEGLFHITTDITLLELSDLGHPLLQRLAIEAPGTYHHSLVVANLAQAAADETGGNSLLARVSAYFHDIGKLTKPDFFTENIKLKNNPHDDLPPSMSTLVITSHVKEGLSLAMLHKLPDAIMNVIREHHGTSLLSSFHHKAKVQPEFEPAEPENAQTDGRLRVNEDDFRYAGPKPRSRESAIISLADAIEAASRSMEKTTPGHIENLVNDIANAKVKDGQLDESELTFAEFTRAKHTFVFSLTNMLHGRVSYPKNKNRTEQQPGTVPGAQGANKKAYAVSDGARQQV